MNRLYRHMIALGVRPAGVRALHRVLRPALRAAVREGRLARSPVDLARVPRPDAKAEDPDDAADAVEGRALTREEVERFVAAARGDRLEALWLVLLTGGLRPCEAFALWWDDVDWEAGAVRVRATLTRAGLDRERYPEEWKLTRPKTARSRRTVTLPAVTMAALRAHRTAQGRERLRAGPLWREHGFVFTTEIGTPLDGGNVASRDFARVMERAGLGEHLDPEPRRSRRGPAPRRRFKPSHRVYDLRHTHATLLLMDGQDLLVVRRRLGHSTIKLTADTYASVMRERAEGAAERLDRMFSGA